MPFLLTYIGVRTVDFFRLLNPAWSIQIFGAPAVCKEAIKPRGRHVIALAPNPLVKLCMVLQPAKNRLSISQVCVHWKPPF